MDLVGIFVNRTPKPVTQKKPNPTANTQIQYKDSADSNQPLQQYHDIDAHVVEVTKDATDYFEGLLKSNSQSPSYYEFINAIKNPAFAVIPSEQAKFAAAFAALSATGLTKQKLLDTANHFLSLIDKDLQNMSDAFKTSYQQKVQGNKSLIENKNKQIQDLSNQIQQLSNDVSKLSKEADENEAVLKANQTSFMSAGNVAKASIIENISKINNFLS